MRYRISFDTDGPIGSIVEAIEKADPTIPIRIEVIDDPSKSKGNQTKIYQRVPQTVLSIMKRRPDDEWDTEEIGVALSKEGYSASSSSPAMTALGSKGLVERVAPSTYRLTAKGRATTPSLNGRTTKKR